jgi:hypothetical protein
VKPQCARCGSRRRRLAPLGYQGANGRRIEGLLVCRPCRSVVADAARLMRDLHLKAALSELLWSGTP